MANLFDSTNYPTTEPSDIIAGDRIAWKRSDLDSDYPIASYSLKYSARLENAGSTEIEITATESGSDYIVEVGQSTTAAYTAGVYHWQAYIIRTSDSERITVDSGTWEVKANRDAATTDPRNHVKKVLDSIEATIEGRASKDQESYSIAGRSLGRTPIADLILLRDKYRTEYVREQRAERVANGLGHSGIIKTRF
ncbi:MAG: hypothetical protein HON50_00010 [Candidatus Marinimicrobia bacterium]|jgi:hypothetical protein|nr:hypothetical protein [Candidatus Neomarinimicrobiota bacterium]